tara:strand:- start:549 stop:800 length:252 start_codon:yes stop_codon:yes gene_type:complete
MPVTATIEQLYSRIVEEQSDEGCHYDYDRQTWLDGQDHHHVTSAGVVGYCGQAVHHCRRVADFLATAPADRVADFLTSSGYTS